MYSKPTSLNAFSHSFSTSLKKEVPNQLSGEKGKNEWCFNAEKVETLLPV